MTTIIIPDWAVITLLGLGASYMIIEMTNKVLDRKIARLNKEIAELLAAREEAPK